MGIIKEDCGSIAKGFSSAQTISFSTPNVERKLRPLPAFSSLEDKSYLKDLKFHIFTNTLDPSTGIVSKFFKVLCPREYGQTCPLCDKKGDAFIARYKELKSTGNSEGAKGVLNLGKRFGFIPEIKSYIRVIDWELNDITRVEILELKKVMLDVIKYAASMGINAMAQEGRFLIATKVYKNNNLSADKIKQHYNIEYIAKISEEPSILTDAEIDTIERSAKTYLEVFKNNIRTTEQLEVLLQQANQKAAQSVRVD